MVMKQTRRPRGRILSQQQLLASVVLAMAFEVVGQRVRVIGDRFLGSW